MALRRARRCPGFPAPRAARSSERRLRRASRRAHAPVLPSRRRGRAPREPTPDESSSTRVARAAPVPTSPTGTASASSTNETYAGRCVGKRRRHRAPPPAGERLEDGPRSGGSRDWCAGKSSVSVPSGSAIAHADRDLGERREDIELRERERRDPVDANGEAQCDQVEPAAAALAAGDGAELAAELAHARLRRALDLARERPLSDARDVRLRDAEHLVDPLRPDPEAHGRARCDRARGRDERVRAVVEIEQRPLGTLEEHAARRRGAPGRRAATCRRRTARAARRSPRSVWRDLLERRTARARRPARARRSSRATRARSSGGGSSGRAGPGRGSRSASPCRHRRGRFRAGSSRSAGCRAAARARRRARHATA